MFMTPYQIVVAPGSLSRLASSNRKKTGAPARPGMSFGWIPIGELNAIVYALAFQASARCRDATVRSKREPL
jgi:hypothetical protein